MKHVKLAAIGIGIAAAFLVVFNTWRIGNETSSVPFSGGVQKQLETQSASEGNVTVSATPYKTGNEWKVDLVFATHSVELGQDLLTHAALYDDASWEYRPAAWEGDAPGGHHRKGTLVFLGVNERTRTLALVIKDIGGIPERTFRWTLTK